MEKTWRSTTILSVRKGAEVIVAGDGQVTLGNTVMKANARKVRRLGKGDVIAGFAGAQGFPGFVARLRHLPMLDYPRAADGR